MISQRFAARDGFSLLEAAVSTLIVGVMLVAAMQALGGTMRARQSQAAQRQGPALARQLMTEILQARYQEPGVPPFFGPGPGESNGTRSLFDDVDDYHGWSESPPKSKSGTPMTDYSGWTRAVTVAFADLNNPSVTAASETGLRRITITVTDPEGVQNTLTALRSIGGGTEQAPASQTTYTTWVGVDLQVGSADSTIKTGSSPVNQEGTR